MVHNGFRQQQMPRLKPRKGVIDINVVDPVHHKPFRLITRRTMRQRRPGDPKDRRTAQQRRRAVQIDYDNSAAPDQIALQVGSLETAKIRTVVAPTADTSMGESPYETTSGAPRARGTLPMAGHLTDPGIEEWIQQVAASAPPMTEDQRTRLSRLLRLNKRHVQRPAA
jgi:hypothetical protein